MSVSSENKAIAKYVRSVVGGSPVVAKYWDDAHASSVDIFSASDAPVTGVTAYAAIGLSDHSFGLHVDDVPLGVEFVAAAATRYDIFPNILATCAFNMINTRMACQPGTVFPRVVEMYKGDSDMKDVLFVPPFLWQLETLDFDSKKVAWLLAVPISEGEHAYARENGSNALEALFEDRQIDIFDLDRESVVQEARWRSRFALPAGRLRFGGV